MSGYLPALFPSTQDEWRAWLENELLPLAITVVIVVVLQWALRRFVTGWVRRMMERAAERRGEDLTLARQRSRTFEAVADWVIVVLAVFVVTTVVLQALGADVTALLASAGILGLALSLGAQQFVRDLINGTFILAENQYQVGDVIRVANVSGTVTELNPRRTVIRDLDGNVHFIPNGQVTVATNMTRTFARINLDIPVPFDEDLVKVFAVLNAACESLAAARPDDFVSEPKVLRVDDIVDDKVIVKVTADVMPFQKNSLSGELRHLIHDGFLEHGIGVTVAPSERDAPQPAAPRMLGEN